MSSGHYDSVDLVDCEQVKQVACIQCLSCVNANWAPEASIGLYRENAIAIESEAKDPNGGNVYYVTMQITFHIPEFARKERNLHCDVVP